MGTSRAAKVVVAGGVLAGAAVAAAAMAAQPVIRDEARRLRRMALPLGVRGAAPPLAPPLPRGFVVNLEGRGEVFYRDTGSTDATALAPPVVLLHGWTVTADLNFFILYDELAGRHRVIAPDHRGHGRGMRSELPFSLEECADDVAALLRLLELPRAVVVGFSLGGAIAMLLQNRHPELVAGMVFCGTALEWQASTHERLIWRGMSLFEAMLRSGTGDGILARVLREMIADAPDLEPLLPWATGEFHRGYPPDIAGAGRALSTYNGRSLAPAVDVPCAVVVTTADQLVRPVKQYQLAEALGADVLTLDGDHMAPFNRGPAFAKAIGTAVERVTTPARPDAPAL